MPYAQVRYGDLIKGATVSIWNKDSKTFMHYTFESMTPQLYSDKQLHNPDAKKLFKMRFEGVETPISAIQYMKDDRIYITDSDGKVQPLVKYFGPGTQTRRNKGGRKTRRRRQSKRRLLSK